MARELNRGEIWLYTFTRPDKQRPVLVLTRQEVIGLLRTVMVAPITSTIRGAPSEVVVGVEEGLKGESAINLDHVQTVEQVRLRRFIGTLGQDKMAKVCRALAIATGCASFSAPSPTSRSWAKRLTVRRPSSASTLSSPTSSSSTSSSRRSPDSTC